MTIFLHSYVLNCIFTQHILVFCKQSWLLLREHSLSGCSEGGCGEAGAIDQAWSQHQAALWSRGWLQQSLEALPVGRGIPLLCRPGAGTRCPPHWRGRDMLGTLSHFTRKCFILIRSQILSIRVQELIFQYQDNFLSSCLVHIPPYPLNAPYWTIPF